MEHVGSVRGHSVIIVPFEYDQLRWSSAIIFRDSQKAVPEYCLQRVD
jgi:hypothetical protein